MADKILFQNHEERKKIQKICDSFQLGKILKWTSLKITAPCMFLLKLQTNQRTYSFKAYPKLKKNQLKKSAEIKKRFNLQDNPHNFIVEDEISYWNIMPWIEGQQLKLKDILPGHIEQIAKTLGKIHKLKITIPDVPHVLANPVIDNYNFGVEDINQKFIYWRNLFERHVDTLQENLIISHGDLLPQNVIWKTDHNPILIDWDNAGWINQDIDVFNTAINWAGIESGLFNQSYYQYFIDSYLIENPRKIEINQSLVAASLGSWLNWLVFNHQLGNKKSVDVTLKSLDILEQMFF